VSGLNGDGKWLKQLLETATGKRHYRSKRTFIKPENEPPNAANRSTTSARIIPKPPRHDSPS
jgi:hypothetical protein